MQFHYRLAFDGEATMFQVFRHLQALYPHLSRTWSMTRAMREDIDTRQEDHIYDECRR